MTVQLLAGGSFGLGLQLEGLQAKLGELQASLSASVSLTAQLQANVLDPTALLTAALAYSAEASASLALAGPSLAASLGAGLDAQLAVNASLTADIGALLLQIEALKAQIALFAGLFVYLYTGPRDQLGSEVGARVAADVPNTLVTAPVIVATSPAAATALLSALGL